MTTPNESEEMDDRGPVVTVPQRRRVPVKRIVVVAILVAVAIYGTKFGLELRAHHLVHIDTDDAQVDANIAPVLSRVAGYVTEVKVEDNQPVSGGDPLVTIDTRDFDMKITQADAALANAEAAVSVAKANLAAAHTGVVKNEADRKRLAVLRAKDEISQQQLDAVEAAHDSAVAQETAASRQIVAAEAQVAQKKADLEFAKLQRSYTVVAAPRRGTIAKKSVEVGQYVQAGQSLMAIVDDSAPWIVANYKETQLRDMHAGQPVEIEVDAYPGFIFFGKVESLSGATGAKFALLPPDNASGNFVKVVQRVPVKIALTGAHDPKHPLRAGMSVKASVDVR
jgi:membrane fusion protein (multidrug efflux system)